MQEGREDYFSFVNSELFNVGPMVSFVWKNDNGWSVESVSKNVSANFFYEVDDFLNGKLSYAQLIHPDDRTRVIQELKDACMNKKHAFTYEPYRLKDGNNEYRWIRNTTTILYDDDQKISYFLGYIFDVTKTRNNLLQLKEHDEKLKTAQALSRIGNWELNLQNNNFFCSEQLYKIFEINPKKIDLSYNACLEIVHPKERKLVSQLYLNSLKNIEPYQAQYRLLMQDGRIKHVEERADYYFDKNGKPIKFIGTIQDISERKEIELELKKTLSFFKSHQLAMDESSMVSKSDLKGNITYVNENVCKITGYIREELLGKPHNILRHPENPKELFVDLWNTIKAKKVWKKILKNRDKYGKDYWVDTTILPILDEKNNIVEYIAVRHNVTQMVHQKEQLDKIANRDTLTGLGNRYKLLNDIQKSKQGALAILNIDNFTHTNDLYGYEIGDDVIIEFGMKLVKFENLTDFEIYHLQADEYVVFHPDIDKETFYTTVSDLQERLSRVVINVKDELMTYDFSLAISYEDKEKLLASADMALRIAKKQHKDIVIYSDEISLNSEYENNLIWVKKLKEAIKTNNIIAVYQPIVNNKTLKYEKYESLVRLRDKDGKLNSPYFFLDIAKKTKRYSYITQVMIAQSFKKFENTDKEFSINLTIEDILNRDINSFIFTMLESYQIGERVVFEIVESESIENFEEVFKFIAVLKEFGCKIAIDDFGTGYSNFEYLMRLQADYIKIDGSLIKDICSNKNSEIIVSTIVDFAKKLGIKTIAEFVENKDILNKVIELGVDYSQGYYFSQPKEAIEE